MAVKVVIVNDYMTDDVEEEQQQILEQLTEELGDVEFVAGSSYFDDDLLSKSFDMLIVDYGGVSAGAQSMVDWQIRAACKWAEEHPNKLLVLWTDHTAWACEQGLKEEFPDLANILYRYGQPFSSFVDDDPFWPLVLRWFGIDAPNTPPMPKLVPPKTRR